MISTRRDMSNVVMTSRYVVRSGVDWTEIRRLARLHHDRQVALRTAAEALALAVDCDQQGRHAEAIEARDCARRAVTAAEKCATALAR